MSIEYMQLAIKDYVIYCEKNRKDIANINILQHNGFNPRTQQLIDETKRAREKYGLTTTSAQSNPGQSILDIFDQMDAERTSAQVTPEITHEVNSMYNPGNEDDRETTDKSIKKAYYLYYFYNYCCLIRNLLRPHCRRPTLKELDEFEALVIQSEDDICDAPIPWPVPWHWPILPGRRRELSGSATQQQPPDAAELERRAQKAREKQQAAAGQGPRVGGKSEISPNKWHELVYTLQQNILLLKKEPGTRPEAVSVRRDSSPHGRGDGSAPQRGGGLNLDPSWLDDHPLG